MITWCGDPGWAAWTMTGGRSPAARWARRRLCEAERDAAVIDTPPGRGQPYKRHIGESGT